VILQLPVHDPQFWIVTAAAVIALAFVLRKRIRVRGSGKPGGIELPCENCPQARQAGAPERLRRWLRGKAGCWIVTALGVSSVPATLAAATVERQVSAMGTKLAVRVDRLERAQGVALSETAIEAVEEADRLLSTWRADSEFARFNAAPPGGVVDFSPSTGAALDLALDCWQESDGAFDPTVAPLVEAWGLRHGGRLPTPEEIARARAALDAGALLSGRGERRRIQPGGVRVEEGGFGKGAALDLALERVGALSPGAGLELDFGGQVAWSGASEPVVARIADPRHRERDVLELTIAEPRGSLSTSGNSERGIFVEGVRVGHLLDPRNGRPAADFGSATVFDSSATRADCRSTALYVLGPERGRRWLEAADAAGREAVLLVVENGALRALVTPGLASGARALVPELRIEALKRSSG
jgi:thiamine biosynthesis lipoprotein